MKTYRIWAYIEEYDEETGEVRHTMGMDDPMRLPDRIGPFATLDEAQRFLISLPRFNTDGSPSIRDLAAQGLLQ